MGRDLHDTLIAKRMRRLLLTRRRLLCTTPDGTVGDAPRFAAFDLPQMRDTFKAVDYKHQRVVRGGRDVAAAGRCDECRMRMKSAHDLAAVARDLPLNSTDVCRVETPRPPATSLVADKYEVEAICRSCKKATDFATSRRLAPRESNDLLKAMTRSQLDQRIRVRRPNGPAAHPRGALTRQRQSGTAAAATDGTTGGSELQRP